MNIPSVWTWRNEKRHFVAEINDGETHLVVYKQWLSSRMRWAYKAEPKSIIEFELKLIEKDQ